MGSNIVAFGKTLTKVSKVVIVLTVCRVFQGTVLIKSAQELLNYTRGEEEQVEQVRAPA